MSKIVDPNAPPPRQGIDIKEYARLRKYSISPQVFPMALKSGLRFVVDEGIPDGAEFRGYAIDHARNLIAIFVEHESFELVHQSEVIPEAPPIKVRKFEPQVSNEN
jgi:hypothetical protein